MKVAVTSQGPYLDSPMDPRFGRARYLVVVETDTGAFSAVDNSPASDAVQGAGIQAGKRVAELGVEALITGHVGPKAFSTLEAAKIKVYTGAAGSVAQAIEQFKKGKLPQAAAADVDGHWV